MSYRKTTLIALSILGIALLALVHHSLGPDASRKSPYAEEINQESPKVGSSYGAQSRAAKARRQKSVKRTQRGRLFVNKAQRSHSPNAENGQIRNWTMEELKKKGKGKLDFKQAEPTQKSHKTQDETVHMTKEEASWRVEAEEHCAGAPDASVKQDCVEDYIAHQKAEKKKAQAAKKKAANSEDSPTESLAKEGSANKPNSQPHALAGAASNQNGSPIISGGTLPRSYSNSTPQRSAEEWIAAIEEQPDQADTFAEGFLQGDISSETFYSVTKAFLQQPATESILIGLQLLKKTPSASSFRELVYTESHLPNRPATANQIRLTLASYSLPRNLPYIEQILAMPNQDSVVMKAIEIALQAARRQYGGGVALYDRQSKALQGSRKVFESILSSLEQLQSTDSEPVRSNAQQAHSQLAGYLGENTIAAM